jgi:hypothetical protein
MHKTIVKKTLFALLALCGFGAALSAPFEADLDLGLYQDIASGSYDLDSLLSVVQTGHNVAGIYQVNAGQDDMGSMAEIHQIGGVGNLAMVWQSGNTHLAKIEQIDGVNNLARLAQVGTGHIANLMQNGGADNVMVVQMLGTNARIDVTQIDATSSVLSVVLNSGSQLQGTQTGAGNYFSAELAPNISVTFTQPGR